MIKPPGRLRSFISPLAGQEEFFPDSDHIPVENPSDIPRVIESLPHYSVLASGEWTAGNRPLTLLTPQRAAFDGKLLCEMSCHLRPEPVSTSCWNEEIFAGQTVPVFGEPCELKVPSGLFSHPWTGQMIQVPNAGCARFWIEFEFGKFLVPQMADSLELLNPSIPQKTEECFQTRFAHRDVDTTRPPKSESPIPCTGFNIIPIIGHYIYCMPSLALDDPQASVALSNPP